MHLTMLLFDFKERIVLRTAITFPRFDCSSRRNQRKCERGKRVRALSLRNELKIVWLSIGFYFRTIYCLLYCNKFFNFWGVECKTIPLPKCTTHTTTERNSDGVRASCFLQKIGYQAFSLVGYFVFHSFTPFHSHRKVTFSCGYNSRTINTALGKTNVSRVTNKMRVRI